MFLTEIKVENSFETISTENIIVSYLIGIIHYFLNRFIMDGALSRLGRSTDFEYSLAALGVFVAAVVLGLAGAFEVLAKLETMEGFLFGTLPSSGVVVPLAKFDTLLDAGKEGKDFLEILGLRLSLVGEMVPQFWGPGAEFGARGDNLGLPAVVSEILMKLPDLISFSCVFLGAGGVLAGVEVVP